MVGEERMKPNSLQEDEFGGSLEVKTVEPERYRVMFTSALMSENR